VTTASDAISHSGVSLRDAIGTANADAAVGLSDTITFEQSLNGATITLSQGQLELTAGSGTTTIDGAGQIAISGNSASRVFDVDSGVQAVLTGLTIENGNSGAFVTLNVPRATGGTYAYGVNGSNIVGAYFDDTGYHGFLYNGTSYTPLNDPLGTNGTVATGISGNNIVGYYFDGNGDYHPFRYNTVNSTFTTVTVPGSLRGLGEATGIDGTKIVGYYYDGNNSAHGFLFDGSSYTTLDVPFGTTPLGINGNNIVGVYNDGYVVHGFLYDGSSYTTLTDPLATTITYATGISGSTIVGYYYDGSAYNGFVYNGSVYTTFNDPLGMGTHRTIINGIDGSSIVGTYGDAGNFVHGFVYTPDVSNGGGILNDGTLTVNHCTLEGNSAAGGGGIFNTGRLTVSNCALSGNSANQGGGIWNEGTLTVNHSNLSGNSATYGGGIDNGGTLTVSDSTFSGNSATGGWGGGIHTDSGGTVIVNNSSLSGNSAGETGGGINAYAGTLTVSNCAFSGNSAGLGGAINSFFSATVTVSDCTLSANSARGDGGGIYSNSSGTLTLTNATLSGNSAYSQGGGIDSNQGVATMSNCTLAGNSATSGGGIYNDYGNTLTMTNCTLSGNSAASAGGGIYNHMLGTVMVTNSVLNNSIVANSTSGGDLYLDSGNGTAFAGSNDLIGDGSNLSSFTNSLQGNPLLAPLANCGGSTQTMALLPGSPAIDSGNNALAVDAQGEPLQFDQRGPGFPRIAGKAVDIGAFEVQVVTPPLDNTPPVTTAVSSGQAYADQHAGWNNTDVTITLSATDPDDTVARTEYSINGGSWTTYTAPFTLSQEGTYTVSYRSVDSVGNIERAHSLTVKIDKAPPVTVATATGTVGASQATGASIVVNGGFETGNFSGWTLSGDWNPWTYLIPTNAWSLSDGGHYEAQLGTTWNLAFLSQTLATVPGQQYTFHYWMRDAVSGDEFQTYWDGQQIADLTNIPAQPWTEYSFTVTATGATTELKLGYQNNHAFFHLDNISVTPVSPTVYTTGVQVSLAATDNLSGVKATYYTVDGGAQQTYSGAFLVTADGAHTVTYWSTDNAGNVEQAHSLTFKIDNTAPVTTAVSSGQAYADQHAGWNNTDVTISLSATDPDDSVARTEYSINGASWTTYTAPFTLSQEGTYTVAYRSVDSAGNVEAAHSLTVNIDKTPPVTTGVSSGQAYADQHAGWNNTDVTITLSATDTGGSGVAATYYTVDHGPAQTYAGAFSLASDGIHTVTYWSADNAGNVEQMRSLTVRIDKTGLISAPPPGFSYDPTTMILTITGKSFMYSQATTADMAGLHTSYTFTMDGSTRTFTGTQLSRVVVNGQGPTATAILVTSDTYTGTDGKPHETAEVVVLGAGGGQIIGPGGGGCVFLQLNNFPTSYAYVGCADSGQLNAKSGEQNIFVTGGGYSYIVGMGEFHLISGANNVYGYSANSSDQAWHYDTAALDSFVSSGRAYSYMSGTDGGKSFFNVAIGFGVNYGIATHGMSFAYLIDSPGNDTFFGSTAFSYLSGTTGGQSLFNVAEGFAVVYGESFVGGMDFAYNYDPSHNVLSGKWTFLM
jgi:predicted outer membrane repeat protein